MDNTTIWMGINTFIEVVRCDINGKRHYRQGGDGIKELTIHLPEDMYASLLTISSVSDYSPETYVLHTVESLVDLLPKCNICGKEFDVCDASENFAIKGKLGYGTKYDGDKLDLHICCECMNNIIDSCVISPVQEE